MKEKAYRRYLGTEDWKQKRRDAIARAENRCQLCNSTGPLHVHHRTYIRAGRERPADLTVLCVGCHYRYHHQPRLVETENKTERKLELDKQILGIVGAGAIQYKNLRTQVHAPRGQTWSRVRRMVNAGSLEWTNGGKYLRLKGE